MSLNSILHTIFWHATSRAMHGVSPLTALAIGAACIAIGLYARYRR